MRIACFVLRFAFVFLSLGIMRVLQLFGCVIVLWVVWVFNVV